MGHAREEGESGDDTDREFDLRVRPLVVPVGVGLPFPVDGL